MQRSYYYLPLLLIFDCIFQEENTLQTFSKIYRGMYYSNDSHSEVYYYERYHSINQIMQPFILSHFLFRYFLVPLLFLYLENLTLSLFFLSCTDSLYLAINQLFVSLSNKSSIWAKLIRLCKPIL